MANDFGIFGSGYRDVPQGKSQETALQYNPGPIGMGMRPQPSSFAHAGDELAGISDALGKASGAIAAWTKDQQALEFMNGKLAAEQGKSVEELAQVGGKLALSGYKVYNAESAADMMLAQGRMQIADTDHAMPFPEYRAKLTSQFNDMLTGIDTSDPLVKEAVTKHADTVLGTLAREQVMAHGKYINEQTIDAGTRYLTTKLSAPDTKMEEVTAFLKSDMGGLSQDDKNKLITNVGITLLEGGRGTEDASNKFKKALGLQEFKPTGRTVASSPAGQRPDVVLEAMFTVESQHQQFDEKGKPLTSPAGAIGFAQVMPKTAPEAARMAGLDWDEHKYKTDPVYNRALGEAYFNNMFQRFGGSYSKAIAAYNYGPTALSALLDDHPYDWRQYVPDETKNHLNKIEGMIGSLDGGQGAAPYTQESFIQQAQKNGLNLDQSLRLYKADEKARNEASNRFNADMLMQEHALVKAVRSGQTTLPGAFDAITKMRDTLNLTDHQMNALASKVVAADDANEKHTAKEAGIDAAIATNTVNELPQSDVRRAFDKQQSTLAGQIAIKAKAAEEQGQKFDAEEAKRSGLADFILQNKGVVDTRISEKMQGASMQDVLTKDMKLNPILVDMYALYKHLYNKGGQELADKYAGKSAEFYNNALMYDSGSDSQTALLGAKSIQTAASAVPGSQVAKPVIDESLAKDAIKTAFEDRDSLLYNLPIFGKYSGKNGVFTNYDSEIDRLAKDPQILSYVKTVAMGELAANPLAKDPYKTAINKLLNGKLDYALGNALIARGDTSIAQDCGMPGEEGTGKVNTYLIKALQIAGPAHYGATWDRWEFDNPLKSINSVNPIPFGPAMTSIGRGVPEGLVTYDSHTKTFTYHPTMLYGSMFRGQKIASDGGVVISADTIKQMYLEDQKSWKDKVLPAMVQLKDKIDKSYDSSGLLDTENTFK